MANMIRIMPHHVTLFARQFVLALPSRSSVQIALHFDNCWRANKGMTTNLIGRIE